MSATVCGATPRARKAACAASRTCSTIALTSARGIRTSRSRQYLAPTRCCAFSTPALIASSTVVIPRRNHSSAVAAPTPCTLVSAAMAIERGVPCSDSSRRSLPVVRSSCAFWRVFPPMPLTPTRSEASLTSKLRPRIALAALEQLNAFHSSSLLFLQLL